MLASESYGYALTGRVEHLFANHLPIAPLCLQAYGDMAHSLGYPLAVVSLIRCIRRVLDTETLCHPLNVSDMGYLQSL